MNEDDLFHLVLEKPAAERATFLSEACAGDAGLRRRIEILLQAHESPGSFLQSPAVTHTAAAHLPAAESPGTVVGPYTLVEQIGEGGFGIVYSARQRLPIRRTVALKVIKPGMDSREVIARFEAERQVLALMDHPHIAKVLDAGSTANGRPYFVMELVKGIPVTDYCDHCKLPLRERLELFASICHAVQHAHQKGVIHRDLKPSNVMIAMQDGVPVPKIIDFGVAKAINHRLTEQTFHTRHAQMLGTPLYMSPEQAEMNPIEVDTRSDIYSLGVVLYELLTGVTPIDRHRLTDASFDELRRIIREEEPPRPSIRLSTLGAAALSTVADQRRTEPGKLAHSMCGELDWIVLKAMEKDRARRYESAGDFARDIERYLNDQPVQACPPSRTYRLKKIIRRHKVLVFAAALAASALVLGMGGTTAALVWALRERDAKEMTVRYERAAKELARKRLSQNEKHVEILGSVFEGLDPRSAGQGAAALRIELGQRLQQAARLLEGESAGDPKTVARLQNQLGVSLIALGHHDLALPLLEKAHLTLESELGAAHIVTAAALNNLASGYRASGQWERAVPLFENVLAKLEQHFGPDHADTLTARYNLASAYSVLKRQDRSIPLYEEALKRSRNAFGPADANTLLTQAGLGSDFLDAGRVNEAVSLLDEALRGLTEQLGSDHPKTASCLSRLGLAYRYSGRLTEAVTLLHQALAAQKAILGADHPDTLGTMNSLALAFRDLGELDNALRLVEQAYAARMEKLGPDHPDTLESLNNLASVHWSLGDLQRAVPLFEETLEKRRALHGPTHVLTLLTQANLGVNYRDSGQIAEGLAILEEVLIAQTESIGLDNHTTLYTLHQLGMTYRAAGRFADALRLLEQTSEHCLQLLGSDHPQTMGSMNDLASLYWSQGQLARSIPLFEEAFERRKATLGPRHPDTLLTMSNLGINYCDAGRLAEALPLLEQALAWQKEHVGPDHLQALATMNNLAGVYWAQKDLNRSIPLFEETLERQKTRLGPRHPQTLRTQVNLGVNYYSAKRRTESIPLLEDALEKHREVLGADHPHTLHNMYNLGSVLFSEKQWGACIPLFEETLERQRATLGPQHADTLATMNNLALAYHEADQSDRALPLFREALDIARRNLGLAHFTTQQLFGNLIRCYERTNQFALAEPLYRDLADVWKEKTGADSTQYAAQLLALGVNLLHQQNHAAAEATLRQCLDIYEKQQPDQWSTFHVSSLVGQALLGQSRHAEAEPLLVLGYRGLKEREDSIPAPLKNLRLREALTRIVRLYDSWSKPEELAPWRHELENLK